MREQRIYILSDSDELAAASAYGPSWASMWKDPDGRRLLPFWDAPAGHAAMTTAEAIAYMTQFEEGP